MDPILYQIFKIIFKKIFRIKTEYYLEFLTPETI